MQSSYLVVLASNANSIVFPYKYESFPESHSESDDQNSRIER